MLVDNIIAASDLFGKYRLVKAGGKPVPERAALIGYFADELHRAPRVMGVRLAHFSLDQLYALQSAYKDRLSRSPGDRVPAHKYFWFMTRLHEQPQVQDSVQ